MWDGECSRPEKDERMKRDGARGTTTRTTIRWNYLFSCVFIFRVITNEVNRNRTKLILLSVEKSHCRLSVHSPARDLSALGGCDATRRDAAHVARSHMCHFYTTGVAHECAAVFDAGKENRTDSPLGRRIKIIPLISDFRVLKTRCLRPAKRDKRKKVGAKYGEEYVKAVDGMSRYSLRHVYTRNSGYSNNVYITAMKIS